jgi:hypothetical protein
MDNGPRDPLALSDSHRRRIGALLGGMRTLLSELHRAGVDPTLTADVEQRVAALERLTGARIPRRGDVVGATVGRIWILACELRPNSLHGYGQLGAYESAVLDREAESLELTVQRLGAAIKRDRQG